MSSLREPIYSMHPARTLCNPQDLTPYSAVSSFNLPAHYDSTLITPVTMSESNSLATKSSPTMSKEKPIKLSPTSGSPTFHLFEDDDFGSSRYNQPMKHKASSPSDSAFPVSPYVCPEPFWGSFGVSATPGSAQTSTSSPPLHHSPKLHSASGVSNESRHSRQPTPTQNSSYGAHNATPILIAPNPSDIRGSIKQENDIYRRHNSLQSNHSTPRSQGPPQGVYIESMSTLSSSGKKRKSPEAGLEGEFLLSNDLTYEEHLLLQLTHTEQLPWKEVAAQFNEKTGKIMKVPALQMRKKRLVERLRVWTDTEERALTIAWEEYEKSKWAAIAKLMLKHGCTSEWTKEAVQKKWYEMHPEDYSYLSEYDLLSRNQGQKRQRAWSDEKDSVGQSLHESDTGPMLSAVSTVTMDQVRSRALSDSSSQVEFHRQQQAQMIFEQQRNRHNSWASGA